jgi:hypothetical protein
MRMIDPYDIPGDGNGGTAAIGSPGHDSRQYLCHVEGDRRIGPWLGRHPRFNHRRRQPRSSSLARSWPT